MEWTFTPPMSSGDVELRISAASEVGSVRAINEDSYFVGPRLVVVADGMGGHAFGDRASQEIVRVFAERHSAASAPSIQFILETIALANTAVCALTPADATDDAVAGSTLTGLALLEAEGASGASTWMAFNVGDSRIYVSGGGGVERITVDHSAVQELVDAGTITQEQAELHPERNVVTRALGVDDVVEADVWLRPAGADQTYILCSDGLTKELGDGQIGHLVSAAIASGAQTSLADELVSAALAAGGRDNVTVIAVTAVWEPQDVDGGAMPRFAMPAFLEETAPRA